MTGFNLSRMWSIYTFPEECLQHKFFFTVGLVHCLHEPEEKPLCFFLTKPLTSQKPKNRASLTAGSDFWETLMWSSVNLPPKKLNNISEKIQSQRCAFLLRWPQHWKLIIRILRQIITHWTQPWRSQRYRLSRPILDAIWYNMSQMERIRSKDRCNSEQRLGLYSERINTKLLKAKQFYHCCWKCHCTSMFQYIQFII